MKKILQTTLCGLTAASLALMPINVYALSQDETVFAKLQPTGAQSYVSVTKHLLNNAGNSRLLDKTNLKDIENINGFESYTLTNDQLTWEAKGADIYYKGETATELPVTVDVTYKLNGVEKPLEEILGQSGEVEITLHYHNSARVGDLYTPFVVAMTTTLPEDSVRNVSVTNGKVISNGRSLAVAAIAAPGLYDSLRLDEIKDLDKITLSFATESFELKDIYSVVTPKILDDSNLKIFSEVDKLSGDAQKLSDSSKELVNGSKSLRDGIQELRDSLAKAQKQLKNTGNLLDDETLDQISSTAARTARRKIGTMQNTINQQVSAQVDAMMGGLNIGFSEAEQRAMARQIIAQVCTPAAPAPGGNSDGAESSDGADSTTSNATSAAANAACMQYVEGTLNGVMQALPGTINGKVSALTPTIKSTLSGSIYQQIEQVAAETAATTARSVATQVASSIQKGLGDKLDTLMSEMLKGVDKLLDGADKLNGGMKKFDSDGIQQLNNVVNGKLKSTSNKAQRLIKLADDYNNFSGIADGADGTTKFVLMIDGKKK